MKSLPSTSISVSLRQLQNALVSISFSEANLTLSREAQSRNVLKSIVSTPLPNSAVLRYLHSSKHLSFTVVTLSGIVTDLRPEEMKTALPIVFTLSGISMLLRFLQLSKAWSEIVSVVEGRITSESE